MNHGRNCMWGIWEFHSIRNFSANLKLLQKSLLRFQTTMRVSFQTSQQSALLFWHHSQVRSLSIMLDNFGLMPETPDQNQFSILSSTPITRKLNKPNSTPDIYPGSKLNFHMQDILEFFKNLQWKNPSLWFLLSFSFFLLT